MKLDINKLNCMNYYIAFNKETDEQWGSWYGQNGIRSLYLNAKKHNEDFKAILKAMNTIDSDGYAPQYVGKTINITMI